MPSKPFDLSALAKKAGLTLLTASGWPDDLSGMIRKEPHGGFYLYVNGAHSRARQRFTVAHEIAHYILHKPLIGNGITENAMYRSGLSDWAEMEANALAADILMPRSAVKTAMGENPDVTAADLAAMFEVSQSAIDIRLGVPSD